MADTNTLQEVEINIDDFTGIGSENVLTPAMFKRDEVDTSVLSHFSSNSNVPDPLEEKKEEVKIEDKEEKTEPFEIPENLTEQLNEQEEIPEDKKAGRPKVETSGLVEYLKDKIEAKTFVPFNDYDEKTSVEDYLKNLSKKDLQSLMDENVKLIENKKEEEAPKKLFDSLPYELQAANDYWMKGGRDLKSIFNALGRVEEVRDLDPTVENDQEKIVEEYLRSTNSDWSSDEVKEQVSEWKDLGQIAKKASQLKPKLDKMKEQIVAYQLQQQEEVVEQRRDAANKYVKNVYDALLPGELGGTKLDPKTQTSLYNGLVRADYQSMSGGNTNRLGHLLEKYQYQEPNYQKIAKVLWLLEDETSFENALIQKGKNTQTGDIVRKLKTEEGNRSSSTSFDEGGSAARKTTFAIPKPGQNIFGRK